MTGEIILGIIAFGMFVGAIIVSLSPPTDGEDDPYDD